MKLLAGLVVGFASLAVVAADSPPFDVNFTETRDNGEVTRKFRFREIERTAAGSLVEMSYDPKPDIPREDDLLWGLCLLMKYRGEQFVRPTPVAGDAFRVQVTFPKSDPLEGMLHAWPVSLKHCSEWKPRLIDGMPTWHEK